MSGVVQPAVGRLTRFAAGLSALASVLHGIVAPEHTHEGWAYAAVLVVAAVAQMLLAVALLAAPPWGQRSGSGPSEVRTVRTAQAVYLLGAVGTAAIVVLYLTTRTADIHHGGHGAGVVLDGGTIDVVSRAAELALIGVLARLYQLAGR
jgi:hypothetical protein